MNTRKIFAALSATALGLSLAVTGICTGVLTEKANAAGGVLINEKNFPDPDFREFVRKYDYNKDGRLSAEESGQRTLTVTGSELETLKGIEYFTELVRLKCDKTDLENLDVSKNKKLTYLSCTGNQLKTLNVSKNTELTSLVCYGNQLTKLDLSKNTKLKTLSCSRNELKTLDLSKNKALTTLHCDGNQIAKLDISKNSNLSYVTCLGNNMKTLITGKNTALSTLTCYNNQLTSLNLSGNTKLFTLSCAKNKLKSLDLSKNAALHSLDCGENLFTKLDLSKNTRLTKIVCKDSSLKTLKLGKLIRVTDLTVVGNSLTALDLSGCTKLETVHCEENQLQTLTVGKQKKLLYLNCNDNLLTELDVSKCSKLNELRVSNNRLLSLNVDSNEKLNFLTCAGNQMGFINARENCAIDCKNNIYPLYKTSMAELTKMGFDLNRAIDWDGAEYDPATDSLINVTKERITYRYFLQHDPNDPNGEYETFTLLVQKRPIPEKLEKVKAIALKEQILLQWSPSWNYKQTVDYYRIYLYENGKYTAIADTEKTSYIIHDLKPGKTYQVLVRAFTDGGGSPYSEADLVTATVK